MAERWGRWIPDCRNKLINKKTDPFRLNLLLKFPWMQIEIKSFTKSWMKTMISVSRNMCDPRSKNTNIDIKPFEKHYAVQQSFHQSEWAEMCRDLGETRLSLTLHTQYRTERNDCEQNHKVFKIQRRGLVMEGEGDIQEEWQKSHLHHRASRSHWCFKHETQTFYLAEEVERTAVEELIRSNGWSGKREKGKMDGHKWLCCRDRVK